MLSYRSCGRQIIALRLGLRLPRRPGRDLLKDQMHEKEQRLGLGDQHDGFLFRIVVQVLMHAGVFDDQRVARLPIEAAAVMDIVALAFEHIEYGAVHMAVPLAVTARREAVDVAFDGLCDLGRTRIDDLLAEILRPAFPFHVLGMIDARLGEQLMHQLAIGAFQGTDEGALLCPAFPDHGFFRSAVMPGTGRFLWQWARPAIAYRPMGTPPSFNIAGRLMARDAWMAKPSHRGHGCQAR